MISASRAGGALLCTCATGLALAGCGGSPARESPAAKLCLPQARQLVAQALSVPVDRIATVPATGNNGMPQCSFRAHPAGRGRFNVTVNVDSSPQPYAVLARTIEEKQQVFSPTRLVPAPIAITGLGLLAAWFPDDRQLMSTEAVRLVTVTVRWGGARQRQEIRFATRLSRLYLGKPNPSKAKVYP